MKTKQVQTRWLLILVASFLLMGSARMKLNAQTFGQTAYSRTDTITQTGPGADYSFWFGGTGWRYRGTGVITNYWHFSADRPDGGWDNHISDQKVWTWDATLNALTGAQYSYARSNISYSANPFTIYLDCTSDSFFWPLDWDYSIGWSTARIWRGSYSSTYTNWDGGIVTSSTSYNTTGAIYTDGPSGSTNQHLYKVKLSLTQEDGTPILASALQSYLGAPVDTNGYAYVWLPDNAATTGNPVFKQGANPAYYSYTAEPTAAQQLGKLIVSTIRRGGASTWPGTRYEGLAQDLGYPVDEGYPSDDQFALDYIMTSPLADKFTALINATLAARGWPLWYQVDQSHGQTAGLSDDGRKYLVMVLLARSTNPDPPEEMDYPKLDRFVGTNFVYRLVNEFAIEATGSNNKFDQNIAGPSLKRKQAKIGKTTVVFEDDVLVRLKIWPGTPAEFLLELGFDKADINDSVAFFAQYMTNSPGANHDTMLGGLAGSPTTRYFCSGRAGPVLVQLEQPLLRRMPPDFACWTTFRVTDNWINVETDRSLRTDCTWPTFFEYEYSYDRMIYRNRSEFPQIDTPFDGFLSLGL